VHRLEVQRIPFSQDADARLRMLKARTGITPNILCRMGFCLSLEEPGVPGKDLCSASGGREINRYTLVGKYDSAFQGLLTARLIEDGAPLDKLDSYFIGHMNRGVELLAARVRTLVDLSNLVPQPAGE